MKCWRLIALLVVAVAYAPAAAYQAGTPSCKPKQRLCRHVGGHLPALSSSSGSSNAFDGSAGDLAAAAPQIATQIFVCTNKWCRDKGSDATMATFTFLTPQSIPVVGVNCLGKCNKGPNARILKADGAFVDASMIRSVENVVDLLQTHLNLQVNITSAEVLRLNYEGNIHLRNGEVDSAIDCYDKALELGDREQEGVLLVMRGTALLQRAYSCRMRHKEVAALAEECLPSSEAVAAVLSSLSAAGPPLRNKAALEYLRRVGAVFKKLDRSPQWLESKARWPAAREGKAVASGEELLGRCVFTWSLYEHALMRALQDLLTATVVLPGFAQAWRRAGDALAELRLYRSATEYYDVAVRLDESLAEALLPAIERLRVVERLSVNAEARGYPPAAIYQLLDDI